MPLACCHLTMHLSSTYPQTARTCFPQPLLHIASVSSVHEACERLRVHHLARTPFCKYSLFCHNLSCCKVYILFSGLRQERMPLGICLVGQLRIHVGVHRDGDGRSVGGISHQMGQRVQR